jgi:NADH dehydrogenase
MSCLQNGTARQTGRVRTVQHLNKTSQPKAGKRPHVVIIGAGFGGLACAAALGGTGIPVTVIDRRNYHLFVPLLYQVATAALSPADIAQPIRKILSRHSNIRVVLDEVTGIDTERRLVRLNPDGPHRDGDILYDRLVIATGSSYSYFGHDEWAAVAPGVKTIEDAQHIRARLLGCFERAELSTDLEEQAMLMTVVIVGGGPTGVELAGAVAELTRYALARDFRRIDPRSARILLVEAGPRLLASFPEELSRYARNALGRLGVTVMTGQAVEKIEEGGATIGGRFIPAGTIVWGAGVAASPAGRWLGVETDRAGRIRVDPDLSVPGREGVYALGDTALGAGDDGKPLPGLAQVAKQQGQHLGAALAANILRGAPMPTFRFKNRGNTAIVGRSAAVFDFGTRRLKGWLAWILWAVVHVYLLVGFEKRLLVSMQWLWRYLTYERGARLIIGDGPAGTGVASAAPVPHVARVQDADDRRAPDAGVTIADRR